MNFLWLLSGLTKHLPSRYMAQRDRHSAARTLCTIPLLAVIRRNLCGKQAAGSVAGSGDVVKHGAMCGSLFMSS